jgi:Ca2+-transporting ATPase
VKKLFADFAVIDVSGQGYESSGQFSCAGQKADGGRFGDLLQAGALNNNAAIEKGAAIGDPTEAALIVAAEKAGFAHADLKANYPRMDEIAFDSDRKMMSTLHRRGQQMMMLTKGAGEQVLARCDRILIHGAIRPLTEDHRTRVLEQNGRFASQALRVLGFARKDLSDRRQFTEDGMIFLGLQAMLDPPRPNVRQAVETCHAAGIRVIMITGDHARTAAAIGADIGIQGEILTGKELDGLDLASRIDRTRIYARVTADHKLKIVQALQRQGQVVAMTGDGVNDAPALKKADIGIAMGISGTDVAREAAEMILTDDNFISIVNAIHEGRGIYDNIKKFVNFMLSSILPKCVPLAPC